MTLTLVAIFTSSFLIALSGALMPGPLLTVTISESSRRGAMAGPLMMVGHAFLELVLVVALLAGLAPWLKKEGVFIAIALAGSSVLFWMAISMFRSLPSLRLDLGGIAPQAAHTGTGAKGLILTGILFSLANPYWTIWWASIGLGYIMHSAKFGLAGVSSFFCGHILADLAWYALIAFGVAKGRRFFSDSLYKRLIGSCAALLIVFAAYFFYSGVEKLSF